MVSKVRKEQDEQNETEWLQHNLMDIMDCYDSNNDRQLGRDEYMLLMANPEAVHYITTFGADTQGLVTLSDVLFEERLQDGDREKTLGFDEFISLVLRQRGGH